MQCQPIRPTITAPNRRAYRPRARRQNVPAEDMPNEYSKEPPVYFPWGQYSEKKGLCMFQPFHRGHVLQLPDVPLQSWSKITKAKRLEIFPLDFEQCTEKSDDSSRGSSKSKSSSRKLKREHVKRPPKKIIKEPTIAKPPDPPKQLKKTRWPTARIRRRLGSRKSKSRSKLSI